MGTNDIHKFVINFLKNPYYTCTIIILCILYLYYPLLFILLAYYSPVFGFGFLVYRMFMHTPHQNIKTKKKFESRRSFRTVHCVRVAEQCDESRSLMQDPPGVRRNAPERSNDILDDMNVEGRNVDARSSVEENPKGVMNLDHRVVDETYRKCSFDDRKVKVQETLEGVEKSLMDLGISDTEGTKRLENLMERRRLRTLSRFNIIRNTIGVGVGSQSCGQISSLHVPKKNPFLYKISSDLPGSAPACVSKNNPFDLPYDPHEEKPILTGNCFEDEFVNAHKKEPVIEDFESLESANDESECFDIEFAVKQLRSLGASKVGMYHDDNKRPLKRLIPNVDVNRAVEEGESSRKAANVVSQADLTKEHEVDHTKEHKVDHDVVSSDQSTSSSYSSEDEFILRPNREAILHCLSMSRMRVISQGSNLLRNAESFDCGPSALFDKSKTDAFFFGSNKQVHYGSTNSFASDMQVEVSEISSPMSTNMSSFDGEGKRSLVNSTNPSELDLNNARFRDLDEVSEHDATEPGFT
ncbi:uncharacterized protein LOC143597641 isoform X2 [Bidens hawaiensis]|uniref:uncharacterized protein LOC143597641 isoform X2 n=1 Tax=Bidens hawaiensis TaxID=980011 RepID=UPI0040494E36